MGKSKALALALGLAAAASAQIKIALIGDSITEGYGLPQGGTTYPDRLGQLLGNGYVTLNAGIGGRTLLYKGDLPYITNNGGKLDHVFAMKPDIVTIALGTNDTKAQNWDAHKADFEHDYLALLDTLYTLNPKPRIFVALPPPIWANSIGERDTALASIIVVIRKVAAERGLPIVDLNAPMKSLQGLFPDGVHPNQAGADTIAHIFQRTLVGPPANRFQEAYYPAAGGDLPYRIYMPEAYSAKEKYPLILALHGAGERGSDDKAQIALHRMAEIWAEDSTQKKQKSFVVAPQCPQNQKWADVNAWNQMYTNTAAMPISVPLAKVVRLVDSLVKALPIDTNRIYVTGLSMGGYGTWDLIERYPGKFAAAMPLSGGCDTSKAALLKGFPIWAFHGAVDPVVPPDADRSMIAKFKANGETVTDYTAKYGTYFANATISREALAAAIDGGAKKLYGEYTDGSHDIWTRTYDDPLAARWLFKQVKRPAGTGIRATRGALGDGRASFLALSGEDPRAVTAALAPGGVYVLSITDVQGTTLARETVRGGAPLPASLARAMRAGGARRVLIERR